MGRSSSCEKTLRKLSRWPMPPTANCSLSIQTPLCLSSSLPGAQWLWSVVPENDRMLKNVVLIQSHSYVFFRSNSEKLTWQKVKLFKHFWWQSCFGSWCLSLLAATINEASELINALVLQVCLRLNSARQLKNAKNTLTKPNPEKTLRSRCHFRANCLRNTLIGQAKNPLLLGNATVINQAHIWWEIFICPIHRFLWLMNYNYN